MPSYLPGLATRHYARGLCSQHHSKADGTMRKTRCCSLSSESRIPLNISHSHPLSSLALLKVALFPLTASWVPPPAYPQQVTDIARQAARVSSCEASGDLDRVVEPRVGTQFILSTDYTISLSASYTRADDTQPPNHHQPAHHSD